MKYFNTLNFTVNIYCKVCLPGPLQTHKNLAYTKECDFCTNEPIGRSRSHGSVGQFFVAIAGSVHLASGAPFGRGNVVIVHHGRRYMERLDIMVKWLVDNRGLSKYCRVYVCQCGGSKV